MPDVARKKRAAPKQTPASAGEPPAAMAAALPMLRVAQELRRWTDTVLGVAGSAADLSMTLAKARSREPEERAAIEQAGTLLRQAREAAQMTTQELGAAVDLSDPDLIEAAESGRAALPFEVVLRLAGIVGRHDPTTFAMKLTRSYNPELWKALEAAGVGRLVVQAGRERELANLYRGCDAARRLSDEDFEAVLAFVKTAFEMAVAFRSNPGQAADSPPG